MFTKPQYFEFFIHTWDSVIFAVKLNLAIANGFELSKRTWRNIYNYAIPRNFAIT